MDSKSYLRRLGFVNFISIMQLIMLRTYFVVYLETDLLTDILIITLLGSLQNLLQIVFRVPLSRISQIFGRKPLILLGIVSFTLSLFFMAVATNWIYVAISTLLLAIGMSAYWPATFAYLGDITDENYGEYNGVLFQYGDIGSIFTTLVAKYLLDIQSFFKDFGLRQLYWIFTILSAILVIIAWFILPESNKGHEDRGPLFSEVISSLKFMVSDTLKMTKAQYLGRIYLLQFIVSFSEFGFVLFFPKLIVDYGYSNGNVAEIILYGTLILILIKPWLGKVSDRFGYLRPVGFSLVVMSISIYLEILSRNFLVLFATYTVVIGVLMISYPAINGGTSRSADNQLRGQAMGVLGIYTSTGRGLSTLYLGLLTSVFDLKIAFLLFASFIMFFGILIFLEHRRVRGFVPFS